jgi:hypothetical protein
MSGAPYLSSYVETKLNNFKADQITIKDHYLNDFKKFYRLVFNVRILTFVFYIYFFSLYVDDLDYYSWIS